MKTNEFDIIRRYFISALTRQHLHPVGIGDDGAVIDVPPGFQLVTSVDSLNEGIHFFAAVSPFDLGHKSLAVSVSDIAAMGAEPVSVLLSLSLPTADLDWLQAFSAGFFTLANQYHIDLIGGDISRGPLSVTTIVNGLVPSGKALLRSRAKIGDRVYVTGELGDAGLALDLLKRGVSDVHDVLLQRLHRPEPRVSLGLALRNIAHSAMDISDGLVADVEKLCMASGVRAVLYGKQLPISEALRQHVSLKEAWNYALSSGDDYELVFTIPVEREHELTGLFSDVALTCIGEIKAGSGVRVLDEKGQIFSLKHSGYEHFS